SFGLLPNIWTQITTQTSYAIRPRCYNCPKPFRASVLILLVRLLPWPGDAFGRAPPLRCLRIRTKSHKGQALLVSPGSVCGFENAYANPLGNHAYPDKPSPAATRHSGRDRRDSSTAA